MKKIWNKTQQIIKSIKTLFIKLVGGQFKKRHEQNKNIELKYYKTKLGYLPFDPQTFREDFETIEKVLKSDYYKHKTKNIKHEYEKVDIIKNILMINYCSRTTYETFKNYQNGINKRAD